MWGFRDVTRVRSRSDLIDWWSDRYWGPGLYRGWGRWTPRARTLRCWVGWHDLVYSVDVGRSWDEPGEPGWECDCGVEGFPPRIRLQDWIYRHLPARLIEWYVNRRYPLEEEE